MIGTCTKCNQEKEIAEGICLDCYGAKPKRKKKEPKVFDVCESCKKDITGVTNIADNKKYCFKCFVVVRQSKRLQEEKDRNAWVEEWMYFKKFLCPKCKLRKHDLEVTFSVIGQVCLKCGTLCNKLKVEEPKQIQGNLE